MLRTPAVIHDEEAQLEATPPNRDSALTAVHAASRHTSVTTFGTPETHTPTAPGPSVEPKINEKPQALDDSDEARLDDESPSDLDDAFCVQWDGPNDPENPMNWSYAFRWWITAIASMLVFNATFASSAPSGLVIEMEMYFGISQEVATLLISLFVAGYCVGPLLWGPLSETIGRRPIYLISFALYFCFQIGCALSKNTASILIFRLLGGAMAASPLTNSGSMMGDIWNVRDRGAALAIFTLAPFAGPSLAPMCGGFLSVGGVSWRWIYWILTIFSGSCFVIIYFSIPETHHPTILLRKAQRKRRETGDNRWHSPSERKKVPLRVLAKIILVKPWKVLFYEPMLLAITVYMSFIYGCLYLLFEAYPIVFSYPQPIGHGFNAGITGLMFVPLFFGGVMSCILAMFYYNPQYIKLIDAYAPSPVPPERRLPMGVLGGTLFMLSFFWFGWTSYPNISFWAPMLAGGCLGLALTLTFLSLFNYILDTYLSVAASALAANTVCRSIFGASFPLFATQMFKTLNPRWASTLLGFVALALAPIPLLFIRYGPVLRQKSRYSPTHV